MMKANSYKKNPHPLILLSHIMSCNFLDAQCLGKHKNRAFKQVSSPSLLGPFQETHLAPHLMQIYHQPEKNFVFHCTSERSHVRMASFKIS